MTVHTGVGMGILIGTGIILTMDPAIRIGIVRTIMDGDTGVRILSIAQTDRPWDGPVWYTGAKVDDLCAVRV